MTRSTTAGPPKPLLGMEGFTMLNQARLIGWAIRSRIHGAGGWWLTIATVATATISAWITWPLGVGVTVATAAAVVAVYLVSVVMFVAAVQLLTNAYRRRRGWLVGYFTPDASQLVHPNREGAWILSDHFARRRGHGLAAAFRRQVFAHLATEADRHQVVIVMGTHSESLVRIYTEDMPGLCIVAQRRSINGPTWSLQRDPHLL